MGMFRFSSGRDPPGTERKLITLFAIKHKKKLEIHESDSSNSPSQSVTVGEVKKVE